MSFKKLFCKMKKHRGSVISDVSKYKTPIYIHPSSKYLHEGDLPSISNISYGDQVLIKKYICNNCGTEVDEYIYLNYHIKIFNRM